MVDGLWLRAFAQTCHGDTRIKRQPLEVVKHAAATIPCRTALSTDRAHQVYGILGSMLGRDWPDRESGCDRIVASAGPTMSSPLGTADGATRSA